MFHAVNAMEAGPDYGVARLDLPSLSGSLSGRHT
jgi:hypothetical protein